MQRRDDIERAQLGVGNLARDEIHAGKIAVGGDLFRRRYQFGTRFHRHHPTARTQI